MRPTSSRVLVLLLLVAAIVLLQRFLFEGDRYRTDPLFPSLAGGCTRFTLAGDSIDARLRLGAEGWVMEGSVSDRADSAAVEGILAIARSATIDALVEEDPRDLAVYGLEDPRATLSIGEDTVRIGAVDGRGGGLFVRYESGGVVYLSRPSLAAVGKIHPRRVRQRRPLLFPYREIEQVTLSRRGSVRTVRREGKNRWRLVEEGLLADPRAVWGIAGEIFDARIHSFRDTLPYDGGEDPLEIRISWPGGEEAVNIGAAVPGTSLLQWESTDRSLPFHLSAYVSDSLAARAGRLTDHRLFEESPLEAGRIVLRRGEREIVVEPREDRAGWRVWMGESFSASGPKVRAFLRNLEGLRAYGTVVSSRSTAVRSDWSLSVDGREVAIEDRGDHLAARRAGDEGTLLLHGSVRSILDLRLADLLTPAAPE